MNLPIAARAAAVALGALALATAARGAPLPAENARPLTGAVFERTPERIERGRYLANAVIGCVLCHSPRDFAQPGAPPIPGREFAGAVIAETDGYRLVAANLTADVATGAGGWPDDALARAIREGVGHDGRGLGGAMWWWSFRFLSDEDVQSIVVYLRSLPAVRNELPERILGPQRERQRAESARPLTTPVPPPDLSTPLERGRYLIDVADCMGCHTGWGKTGVFAGGNAIEYHGQVSWSANLTPDPSATGGWTEAMFVGRMRSGRGGALSPLMPWAAYRQMTDEDLGAIYAALREVPPYRHWVNNVDEPTDCVVCGGKHGLGAMNVPRGIERADVDLGPLVDYLGRYRLQDDEIEIEIFEQDGALHTHDEAGESVELIPIAGGRFDAVGLLTPCAFERDASGAVVALLTFELGVSRWPRVSP
jgi:mono/diheme cytochrome c family protein